MQIDRGSVCANVSMRIVISERPQLQNKHCKHSITPTEMHQVHLLVFAKHVCMFAELVCMFAGLVCMFAELVCMFAGLVCMFAEMVCMSGKNHALETRSDSLRKPFSI